MNKLSNREYQVISFVAKGYTSKEIARIVGLDYRTIQAYLSNVKKKLKAKNITHAIYIICNESDNTMLDRCRTIES